MLIFKRSFSLFNLVSNYEVLISKYAFYCYYITFYNLELSTFCNNLISLIISYFNKIGVFFYKIKNPGERFDWSIDIVAVDKCVM